ncbi:MAG: tetratricopeptide repeat protein, partial [Chthoniobacterales bacterium]
DLYLRASYQFAQQSSASIRQSLELYKATVAKAPTFALGYVGIAQAEYALMTITAESPDEGVPHVKQALHKALTLDPHLGEARGLLASLIYWREWNWPEAERQYHLALADGAQAQTQRRFGVELVTRGRFAEGMAHLETALELDPMSLSPRTSLALAYYFQRKYPEARRAVEDALTLNPDFLAGHVVRGLVAMLQRDCTPTAIEAAWIRSHYPSPLADFEAALTDACRANAAAARQDLARMTASKARPFASPYQLALGYAAIRDDETALTYLEKSAAIHEGQATYLKVEPLFDSLRAKHRFVSLEKKMGF